MKKLIVLRSASLLAAALFWVPWTASCADTNNVRNQVKIDNFSFVPPVLTVSNGTTVTWINRDDIPHTVTSVDKRFASPVLDTDQQFKFTFTAPGTYNYYCTIHSHMTARVVVR